MNERPMGREFRARRTTRLRNHAYVGTAAYFITLCTVNRETIFGEIPNDVVSLTTCGTIVEKEWKRTFEIRKEATIDEFIIMPDHFHAIVWIENPQNLDHGSMFRPKRSLGALVAGFKSMATREINLLRNLNGVPVWQRNYHDRIIRNDDELNRIREYIRQNPRRWRERHVEPPGRFPTSV